MGPTAKIEKVSFLSYLDWGANMAAQVDSARVDRVRIEPLAQQQFGFFLGEQEVTRWDFSHTSPRPFFFPILGPSGRSLTRMGHPGAPDHDHHRSLWFAHSDLMGIDFWSENSPARIRQSRWYAIEDGNDSARIAVELHWTDGHDPKPLLKQDLFVTIRERTDGWTLELQSDFRAEAEGIEFRKSNFGILGLRVAKSLSVAFGSGKITGADGFEGEPDLFGKANRWIDYSGPVYVDPKKAAAEQTGEKDWVTEGLTLIDHRSNPNYPAKWHVRSDGWIGPSLSRDANVLVPINRPLTYRYLLLVHAGRCNPKQIEAIASSFDDSPPLQVQKSSKPHQQFVISAAEKGA